MRASIIYGAILGLSTFTKLCAAASSCAPSLPPRPTVAPFPYNHGKPHAVSPRRTKTCYVHAFGNGQDDSQIIFSAAKACNNGGTVALLDPKYIIGQALDLTFLQSVDFIIKGEISFTEDINYWLQASFKYTYQGACLFWQFGGKDVNIYGGGMINGNGQVWWDRMVTNITLQRPILVGVVGLQGGTFNDLSLSNPPNWFHFVANSSDLIFDNMTMTVLSNNSNPSKNSDGWDLYRSDAIVIQNSYISNTDDCVSFKPNSTNVVVQNLRCTGSHGISVGSLGQYLGETDIAENLYIYNTSMSNAGDGARIKVYPGAVPGSNSTSSGGGVGIVRNVTYNGMHDTGVDYAIELTQCYGQSNVTLCNMYPSKMLIEDIVFNDFTGTSKKYDPTVGTLVCSNQTACQNIVATNINITNPSGKVAQWTCKNVDKSTLAINCV
ncbi:glycoside hydrolase family 28 protein [Hyaloscypha bicolor E]|uniref:galacturonan 1,4-alpha-galacturonidase n=1 Tax=Hyaloscypha bicolor E TaxID=1095630 RepID=A0A2J6TWJ8_9HELO|nr:glycoside hydrolase family 28 protein [Hyaloscypha bicolor E]PMD67414.1 glycoside hydrolase family 28 protein [Hyaloscypha bicolor E]